MRSDWLLTDEEFAGALFAAPEEDKLITDFMLTTQANKVLSKVVELLQKNWDKLEYDIERFDTMFQETKAAHLERTVNQCMLQQAVLEGLIKELEGLGK